jgi:hypothetical protein
LAIFLTPTFLLWFYFKKKRTGTLWVFFGPQKGSMKRYGALLLFAVQKIYDKEYM